LSQKAPSVDQRLNIIQELHEAKVTVGVTAIPLLPYITDQEKDIEILVETLTDKGVNYVIVDMLNFREDTKNRFLEFSRHYDSALIPKYEKLYQTKYCDKQYTKKIRSQINKLIKKHKVDNYSKMFSYRKKSKFDDILLVNLGGNPTPRIFYTDRILRKLFQWNNSLNLLLSVLYLKRIEALL